MYHRKHLDNRWFSLIQKGEKTIEGRLNKGSTANIREGDIVEWSNNDSDSFQTKVVRIKYYSTFREMMLKESLGNVLPGIETIDDGVKIYQQYYSTSDEKKYGVVALKLQKL